MRKLLGILTIASVLLIGAATSFAGGRDGGGRGGDRGWGGPRYERHDGGWGRGYYGGYRGYGHVTVYGAYPYYSPVYVSPPVIVAPAYYPPEVIYAAPPVVYAPAPAVVVVGGGYRYHRGFAFGFGW